MTEEEFIIAKIKVIKDTITLMLAYKKEFTEKLGGNKAYQLEIDNQLDLLLVYQNKLNDFRK